MFLSHDSRVLSQSVTVIINVSAFVTTLNEAFPFSRCFLIHLISLIHLNIIYFVLLTPTTTSNHTACTQYKSEIIPATTIIVGIYCNIIIKQTAYPTNRKYQPMPQAAPKSVGVTGNTIFYVWADICTTGK